MPKTPPTAAPILQPMVMEFTHPRIRGGIDACNCENHDWLPYRCAYRCCSRYLASSNPSLSWTWGAIIIFLSSVLVLCL